MIRVYLDWNVLSQIKNGHHAELMQILSDDNRFHKIYSTAHIGDIHAGFTGDDHQTKLVDSDLEFISQVTLNFCASTQNGNVVMEQRDPKELFEYRKIPILPFSEFDFEEGVIDRVALEELKKSRELLMNIPLIGILKDIYKDEKSAKEFNELYPGLKDNQTMGGMIEVVISRLKGMNESTEYKDMRQRLQKGLAVNRDRLFDCADPIGVIEKIYLKKGRAPYLKEFTHLPKWYGDILNWYLLLDMHGYQEDNVSVDKGRKETFKNTTNDAFHTAFASTCDFYIINDKKSRKKAIAVYKKLNLNTTILDSDGFVDYYNRFLSFETVEDHFHTMISIFKSKPDQVLEDEHSILSCFYFPNFLFNTFTRAHINHDKASGESSYFLSKDKPTNGKWTFQMEIEKLVDMLNSIFGDDQEQLGIYDPDRENLSDEWQGRKWKLDTVTFRLTFVNGWVQLYMDF